MIYEPHILSLVCTFFDIPFPFSYYPFHLCDPFPSLLFQLFYSYNPISLIHSSPNPSLTQPIPHPTHTSDCIRDLDTQFPDSHRVKRLKGMHLESIGKSREAQHLYDEILKEDPTNSLVSKRKVAIMRADNKPAEAIQLLGAYLKTYMNDLEAWQELCDLYLKVQDYAKAAHTMEELVITHPHHHLYQQRYADILYTMGGMDNIGMCYFCAFV